MTPAAPIDPRHWRRGLAKAARRPVRAVLRYRPSPIVGALLLGAIVGGGLTAITAGVVADHSPTDQAVISQTLTGASPNGNDGSGGPWDRFGDHHGLRGMNAHDRGNGG
jgi:hypothetical protein